MTLDGRARVLLGRRDGHRETVACVGRPRRKIRVERRDEHRPVGDDVAAARQRAGLVIRRGRPRVDVPLRNVGRAVVDVLHDDRVLSETVVPDLSRDAKALAAFNRVERHGEVRLAVAR